MPSWAQVDFLFGFLVGLCLFTPLARFVSWLSHLGDF